MRVAHHHLKRNAKPYAARRIKNMTLSARNKKSRNKYGAHREIIIREISADNETL